MSDLVTNGSLNYERVSQAELEKVRKLHDEHSKDIDHENKTIAPEDTELNYHENLLNLDSLLQEQYGDEIEKKNEKLTQQFNDGEISLARYQERFMTIDKWLNHSGKNAKKAFTLAVCYMGDSDQTKEKLDDLGFDYTVEQLKGEDGEMHNHFHLTDPKQRKQWKKLWADAFRAYAVQINKKNSGIKIFDMTVHMDEASPHCHFKVLNCGHTKNGKASYNLTQALSDFNLSCGHARQYNKVTKKSPKQRLSGKATLKTNRAILDKFAVEALNWSAKRNGINAKWSFKHKGKEAKLTNQMTPKEFKEYKAAKQGLSDAYKAVTGRKAVDKDNNPLSPLETARGLHKASKDIEKQKEEAEAKQAENEENESKLREQASNAKFNAFVQHQFIIRLNQRRLQRLRQREESVKNEINGAKDQLIDQLRENDPNHEVSPKLLKKGELPKAIKTEIGRQQHKRQTLKYLMESVKKSYDMVKQRAEQAVNKVVDDFINTMFKSSKDYEFQRGKQLGSRQLDFSNIKASQYPMDVKQERRLENDPALKVKKALLFASDEQIKQGQRGLRSKAKTIDDDLQF